MVQASQRELREVAGTASTDELKRFAQILERNLKALERMNTDHKEQTEAGHTRLENNLVVLGTQVSEGFERIFKQDGGLAGSITAIQTELKHKPDYKGLYGAVFAQIAGVVAIIGLARYFGLI